MRKVVVVRWLVLQVEKAHATDCSDSYYRFIQVRILNTRQINRYHVKEVVISKNLAKKCRNGRSSIQFIPSAIIVLVPVVSNLPAESYYFFNSNFLGSRPMMEPAKRNAK